MAKSRVAFSFNDKLFAAAIRAKRDDKGLRWASEQIEACTNGFVSTATLSRIDSGLPPDLTTILTICEWLEQSPADFIDGIAEDYETPPLQRIAQVIYSLPDFPEKKADAFMRLVESVFELNDIENRSQQ